METGTEEKPKETSNNETSNANSSDLDEETTIKLRGDAIGDTVYSQSFVLKTLLQFSDLKWSEEYEEDLCFLWDMTVDKDVCKYLFEVSYPSLACSALEEYTENRFIEIVIGILANILCAQCEENMTPDQINIVLRVLNSYDHLILIQVIRFIIAVAHKFDTLTFITNSDIAHILYILDNSTNNELLIKTLEALSCITSDFKLNSRLVSILIIRSSLTAYKSIIDEWEEFNLETEDKRLICKYMLKLTSNCCAYINRNEPLLHDITAMKQLFNDSEFLNEIIKILHWFSHEENLMPITEDFIFYISALTYIFTTLNITYVSEIFLYITKICYFISDIKDECSELFESLVELECFLLNRGTPNLLYRDLKNISKSKVRKVLTVINETEHNFDFDLGLLCVMDKFK